MKEFKFIILLLVFSLVSCDQEWPIKNVVVLMMENRAFDHMIGYIKEIIPEVQGLYGNETNPYDVSDPTKGQAIVSPNATYVDQDPSHSMRDTTEQIFGSFEETDEPKMNGFVMNLERYSPGQGHQAINMFNPQTVPIISTLAQEFALFDQWFAAVPGPTQPNRLYFHTGTSNGTAGNDPVKSAEGYPQKTLYEQLDEVGKSWNIYWSDTATAFALKRMRTVDCMLKMKKFDKFFEDAKAGNLAEFVFLEPYFSPTKSRPANDQHPDHAVNEGEKLMKEVYESLRASPQWNQTLFIITYDEHGGFYDHYAPPMNVPNPDGIVQENPPFNFTRLGIRIPTILISPWINKQVVHGPKGPLPDSQYTHTSVIATLKKMWGFKDFLTKRVEWSGTFEHLLLERNEPRTDCIQTLPDVPGLSEEQHQKELKQPINSLQLEFLQLAANLNGISDHEKLASNQEEANIMTTLLYEKFMREEIERQLKEKQNNKEIIKTE